MAKLDVTPLPLDASLVLKMPFSLGRCARNKKINNVRGRLAKRHKEGSLYSVLGSVLTGRLHFFKDFLNKRARSPTKVMDTCLF